MLTKRAKMAYNYGRRYASIESNVLPNDEYKKIYARQQELKKENSQMSFWDIIQNILEEDIEWIPYKGTKIVKTKTMRRIEKMRLIKAFEKRQLDKECEKVYQKQQALRQQKPGISLYEIFYTISPEG